MLRMALTVVAVTVGPSLNGVNRWAGERVAGGRYRAKIAVFAVAISGVMTACASGPSAGGGGAAASCVGPALSVSRTSVAAGGSLEVSGRWFVRECQDVVVNGQSPPWNPPIESVPLVLTAHDGHRFDIGTAHPDSEGSFTITVRVPDGVAVGRAMVTGGDVLLIPAQVVIT